MASDLFNLCSEGGRWPKLLLKRSEGGVLQTKSPWQKTFWQLERSHDFMDGKWGNEERECVFGPVEGGIYR